MPVKIRLMRIGAKKRPFFRVVAVDEQKKRTGAYLELLGTYNPLTNPKEILLKQDRIDDWIKKGAQPSDGFLRITGKAPQRPPRKPKKAQKTAPEAAQAQEPKTEKETPSETESAPAEEAAVPEVEPTPTETESAETQEKLEKVEGKEELETEAAQADTIEAPVEEALADQIDVPVTSETSLNEAPTAESAKEAAEVLVPETETTEESK